jgi:hypothetical protein
MALTPGARVDPPLQSQVASGDTGAPSQVWAEYHVSVEDRLNAIGTGVVDGSDAAAGKVGEYMEASGSIGLTTTVVANVATLNLTPGDWDVWGGVTFSAGAGTHTSFGVGLDGIVVYNQSTFPAGAITQGINTSIKRYNVTVATVVQLEAVSTFSGGTMTVQGVVRARRVR